jgi:DNA repair protein RecO (recombination protein O)
MIRTVGIVLQVVPFQDYHQIVTLYSPEWGIIKLISKFAKTKNSSFRTEPLNLIEVIYKQGKSDLYQAINTTLLDTQLKLRERFDTLNASMEMILALLKSQMAQKPSPVLFSLLLHYLDYLPKVSSPDAFTASFRLKILRHDGLVAAEKKCSTCSTPLQEGGMEGGELFCMDHLSKDALAFSRDEMYTLQELALSRSLIHLNELKLSPILQKKIQTLFEMLIAC